MSLEDRPPYGDSPREISAAEMGLSDEEVAVLVKAVEGGFLDEIFRKACSTSTQFYPDWQGWWPSFNEAFSGILGRPVAPYSTDLDDVAHTLFSTVNVRCSVVDGFIKAGR